ncbi:UNVERIFIED_CONTAM: hypothetical protein Slati_3454400 [Sesamum latifolium]|uniref:Integrase zinc-binding domain-containing protein n=1 Tax=Sesamum latifolium TaxID=2727402 RepID=A0AAW2UH96_9LAMI
MLLQEFNLEIKDRRRCENTVADHLCRLNSDYVETMYDSPLRDEFPDDKLFAITQMGDPWFADFANFLVGKVIPSHLSYQQRKRFFSDIKYYLWDEPYLYKRCGDGMVRRCVLEEEMQSILGFCHDREVGGHHGGLKQQQRCYNVVSIGHPCSKMPTSMRAAQASAQRVDEIRHHAYENARIFKERTKAWHDARIQPKEFFEGNKMLLFNSRLELFPGKLRSKSSGPYIVTHVFPHGAVELFGEKGPFKVNGHWLKHYIEGAQPLRLEPPLQLSTN